MIANNDILLFKYLPDEGLFIYQSALVEICGVKIATISNAKYRKSSSWKIINDPDFKTRNLVHYESLKDSYKQLVINHFGDPYTFTLNNNVQNLFRNSTKDLQLIRSFKLTSGEGIPSKHQEQYLKACQYLHLLSSITLKTIKSLGFKSKDHFYSVIIEMLSVDPLIPAKFPKSKRKIQAKVAEYRKMGAECVISKRFGKGNNTKITDHARDVAIAEYAQPYKPSLEKVTDKVNDILTDKEVTQAAVKRLLNLPPNRQLWFLGRHGQKEWKKEYGHGNRLFLPTYRDAMWNIDGTKLNLYHKYNNKQKMAALFQIVKVTDIASEKILSWTLTKPGQTENSSHQYKTIKQAIMNTNVLPFQLLYDGQGGHIMAETQEFYDRLARVHFRAMPYNGQSKPIESLIGRFQKQVMRDRWYFTGMNITTNTLDSKPNMDYILKHKEQLPEMEDIPAIVSEMVDEWNNSPHPDKRFKGKSRNEVYEQSLNPEPREVSYWDIVELFWVFTKKEITYRRDGIRLTVNGEKYWYEVVDEENLPDMKFRENYLLDKFIVKYDIEDLSQVLLYKKEQSGDLRYVAVAKDKEAFPRFVGDYKEDTGERIRETLKRRKEEPKEVGKKLEEVCDRAGSNEAIEDYETSFQQRAYGGKTESNMAESMLDIGVSTSPYEDVDEIETGRILE
jgi:hypothetical protein